LNENAWQQDAVTGETWVSAALWQRLGYDLDLLPLSREALRELAHPRDLALAADEIQLHRDADEPFEFEVRLRADSGEWRFMRMRGCVTEWSDDGEAALIGGIINDVTEQITAARAQRKAEDLIATLSRRERQVLDCLVAGAANKNIAYALELSQRTVEGYRARLMDKMEVRGLGELVQVAIAGGVTGINAGACGLAPEAE
jgi:DNA-binding CsgD family transcriptional regulator